jgi:hypothetical protein
MNEERVPCVRLSCESLPPARETRSYLQFTFSILEQSCTHNVNSFLSFSRGDIFDKLAWSVGIKKASGLAGYVVT